MYNTNPTATFVRFFNRTVKLCDNPQTTKPQDEEAKADLKNTCLIAIGKFLAKQTPTETDYSAIVQLSLCEDVEIFLELVNAFLVKFQEHQLPGHLAIINLANIFASSFYKAIPQENFSKVLEAFTTHLTNITTNFSVEQIFNFLNAFSIFLDTLIAIKQIPWSKKDPVKINLQTALDKIKFDNDKISWIKNYIGLQLEELTEKPNPRDELKEKGKLVISILFTLSIAGVSGAVTVLEATSGALAPAAVLTGFQCIQTLYQVVPLVQELFKPDPRNTNLYQKLNKIRVLFQLLRLAIEWEKSGLFFDITAAKKILPAITSADIEKMQPAYLIKEIITLINIYLGELYLVNHKKEHSDEYLCLILEFQNVDLLNFLFVTNPEALYADVITRLLSDANMQKFKHAEVEKNILNTLILLLSPKLSLKFYPKINNANEAAEILISTTITFFSTTREAHEKYRHIYREANEEIDKILSITPTNEAERQKQNHAFLNKKYLNEKLFNKNITLKISAYLFQAMLEYNLYLPHYYYVQAFSTKIASDSDGFYSPYHYYPTLSQRYYRRTSADRMLELLNKKLIEVKKTKQPAFIFVTGKSGTGKSALVADVVHQIARESSVVAHIDNNSVNDLLIWWFEDPTTYSFLNVKNDSIKPDTVSWDYPYKLLYNQLYETTNTPGNGFTRQSIQQLRQTGFREIKRLTIKKNKLCIFIFDNITLEKFVAYHYRPPETFFRGFTCVVILIPTAKKPSDLGQIFNIQKENEINLDFNLNDIGEKSENTDRLLAITFSDTIKSTNNAPYELLRESPRYFIRKIPNYLDLWDKAVTFTAWLPNMFAIVMVASLLKIDSEIGTMLAKTPLQAFEALDNELKQQSTSEWDLRINYIKYCINYVRKINRQKKYSPDLRKKLNFPESEAGTTIEKLFTEATLINQFKQATRAANNSQPHAPTSNFLVSYTRNCINHVRKINRQKKYHPDRRTMLNFPENESGITVEKLVSDDDYNKFKSQTKFQLALKLIIKNLIVKIGSKFPKPIFEALYKILVLVCAERKIEVVQEYSLLHLYQFEEVIFDQALEVGARYNLLIREENNDKVTSSQSTYHTKKYNRQIRVHSLFKEIFEQIKFDFIENKHPFVAAVDDLYHNYFDYSQRSAEDNRERVAFLTQELQFLLMHIPPTNSKALWRIKVAQGMSYWDLGDYPKSLECFSKAKSYFKEGETQSDHYAGVTARSLGKVVKAITLQENLVAHPKIKFEEWKHRIAIHKELLILYSILCNSGMVTHHFKQIELLQKKNKNAISDYHMAKARKIFFDAEKNGAEAAAIVDKKRVYEQACKDIQEILKQMTQLGPKVETDYQLILLLLAHLYLYLSETVQFKRLAQESFAICKRAHSPEHIRYLWAQYFLLNALYMEKYHPQTNPNPQPQASNLINFYSSILRNEQTMTLTPEKILIFWNMAKFLHRTGKTITINTSVLSAENMYLLTRDLLDKFFNIQFLPDLPPPLPLTTIITFIRSPQICLFARKLLTLKLHILMDMQRLPDALRNQTNLDSLHNEIANTQNYIDQLVSKYNQLRQHAELTDTTHITIPDNRPITALLNDPANDITRPIFRVSSYFIY